MNWYASSARASGGKHFDIILVEPHRTHVWKPLLHEVAAGSLDANLDEVGYRSHGHRWGYRFFMGRLESIDRAARQVVIAPLLDDEGAEIIGRQTIRYDYLVLAVGSVTNAFATPGADKNCIFLDDREDADRFRLKLLNQCLRVSRQMSENPASDAHVRVAIVGGGATGVELAAELYNAAAGLRHYGLEVFDESRLEITLIEAGPRILPALPEKLADAAREELEALGVRVMTGARVAEVTASGVATAGGEVIAADLRVWAAGVKGADSCATSAASKPMPPINSWCARRSKPRATPPSSPSAIAARVRRPAASGLYRRARKPPTRWPTPPSPISAR